MNILIILEMTSWQNFVRVGKVNLWYCLGEGGALDKMLMPFKLGLGGTIGNGSPISIFYTYK